MAIDDQIENEKKNCNMILIEELQKFHPHHQAKLVSVNMLLVRKYCHLIKTNNRTR